MTQPEKPPRTIAEHLEQWVITQIKQSTSIPILMVSGAQGIGKTTALAGLQNNTGLNIAVLGIDDFYLNKEDRKQLALNIHPLFEMRGGPGTHDLALLHNVIDALLQAEPITRTPIPRFDKVEDTRAALTEWQVFTGRPDAILIEGWLMGVDADPASSAEPPLNAIEAQDPNGVWRAFQEADLDSHYATLWDRADAFFHIDAPGFETVLDWRLQQEGTTLGVPRANLPQERVEWVTEFILYFERLTRRMLAGHRRRGHVLRVDANRRPPRK